MTGELPLGPRLAIEGRLRRLEERLEAVEGPVAEISAGVAALLAEQHHTRPAMIHWPDLVGADHTERWAQLVLWVADVLERYPGDAEALLPCWPQHPDAVDAVTASWLTWVHAYRNPAAGPEVAATWQDRWRPAMTGQLRAALRGCGSEHRAHAMG